MLELMNKMIEVSRELFEVVPPERLQGLAKKVLVKPIQRAMKKVEKPDVAEAIQEAIDSLLEDFTSESMAMLAFATLANSDKADKLSEYMECLDAFGDIKPMIEEYVGVIEKHAVAIGRIVERIIVVVYEIKTDLSDEDEE